MPEKTESDLYAVSPLSYVSALQAPVFLLHGTKDGIVDYWHSSAFEEAAKAAGKSVTLLPLEGAGHRNYSDDLNTEVLIQMDRFMRQCMPPHRLTPVQQEALE